MLTTFNNLVNVSTFFQNYSSCKFFVSCAHPAEAHPHWGCGRPRPQNRPSKHGTCQFLQLECGAEHDGASAKTIVVAVGVDAVEEGVGVAALVQEVGEFQAEDALLPFVLCGGVEEGHALVLFRIRNNIGVFYKLCRIDF